MKYYKNEFNCNILSFLYCIFFKYIKFNIRYYKKIEDLYEVIIIFFNLWLFCSNFCFKCKILFSKIK